LEHPSTVINCGHEDVIYTRRGHYNKVHSGYDRKIVIIGFLHYKATRYFSALLIIKIAILFYFRAAQNPAKGVSDGAGL
jgi:hypothetical protein